ncbi:expressed unknown protein [Seminavis robusta]|uniref:MYND-type domain-containing protein n=1 Tax=Seminavis robusta TaxID=568900 RepID=A0A9N8DJ15_9STRA|nr:expressed unknown protein [Seminavis robusta]|eukprot:Sro179_g078370.1 n/a (477) ;mRNA; f:13831-15425
MSSLETAVVKLDPSKVPKFLGGAEEKFGPKAMIRLPTETNYAKLPRMSSHVFFETTTHITNDGHSDHFISASHEHPNSPDAMVHFLIEEDRFVWGVMFSGIDSHWRESQKEALAYRILHIYLREYGAGLPKETAYYLGRRITVTYRSKKYWKELLDVTLALADLGFFFNISMTGIFLINAARSFHRLGRMEEAALIWDDLAAEKILQSLCDQDFGEASSEKDTSHLEAGLAYVTLRKFPDAERSYINGLCRVLQAEAVGNLGMEAMKAGRDINKAIVWLLRCYAGWVAHSHNGNLLDHEGTDVRVVEVALGCLAAACGFEGHKVQHYDVYFGNVIKNKYRHNQSTARKLLDAALALQPDVVKFRAKLLVAIKDGSTAKIAAKYSQRDAATSLGVRELLPSKQYYKNFLQGFVIVPDEKDNIGKCKNCEDFFAITLLRNCPCRTVSYCCKECQLAHWKLAHRRECPLRGKTKGTKSS